MRSETGVSWLDAAVSKANVPQTVDTETAIEIHLRITGEELSDETYRRFPVPYRLIGRERRYTVDDVVNYAKQRFEQAPVRRSGASVTRRRPETEARHREAPPLPPHSVQRPATQQPQPEACVVVEPVVPTRIAADQKPAIAAQPVRKGLATIESGLSAGSVSPREQVPPVQSEADYGGFDRDDDIPF